jgi:gamma-D-glutamyl-L-lysine dipeptidyl-peptidase
MKYGICNLSVVPVRSSPLDKSEMVTQLLFGETCQVLDKQANWLLIQSLYDAYEGWVEAKQLAELTEEGYHELMQSKPLVSTSLISELRAGESRILLSFGSSLQRLHADQLILNGSAFTFSGSYADTSLPDAEKIRQFAMQLLDVAYLWGGRTVMGIDCSGFIQLVYKAAGIKLKRDSSEQATQGKTIDFIEETKVGDLAFFDNEDGKIVHTGIILGDGSIIHASGQVRVDSLDHLGIFNADKQLYTHKLRLLKRMIE